MAPPVYSTRFLHGRSTGTVQSLSVPADHRAVVRFVTIVTHAGTADYVLVRVAGVPVVWLSTPTAQVTKHYDVRCVAYAGESIELYTEGGDVAWHVAGFLFRDD